MGKLRTYLVIKYDQLVREPKFIWKYYRPFHFFCKKKEQRNIFMVDGKIPHGGMFDRLKGIISVYAVSKARNVDFKIKFIYPFDLLKYLEPNDYDWSINSKEICSYFPTSKPLIAYGEYMNPRRIMESHSGECHFYYGYNSLSEINKKFETHFDWGTLYRELFKPTPYLQKYLDYYKQDIGEKYIVVHTRFLNLLGDKVETDINPELSEEKKQKLQSLCCNCIAKINEDFLKTEPEGKVMLASDSMIFLDYMKKKIPNVYVVPGVVKHIDTAKQTSDDENVKMFIDYYLIVGAEKIYNIVGPGMWKSAFSEYPAKIGNKPFERIFL